ncbi:NAD(P)H dehydrogenase [Bacillus sp. AFS015802]|uniref:NAD(P)H oxidoreductase n=1 Tax=Bacillus sp. AFS015802 TaxID=2033486 RepID=UPI000BF6712B|nr:NAD(P)H oxidoreductase [Bacillus sp. AFS015802]PFA69458.1 NAD(P)H dehydrogenase [Bacillus sp. AFS015802]
MKVLMVVAHPSTNSLTFSITKHIQKGLHDKEYKSSILDLYREEFNPVLDENGEEEWDNIMKGKPSHIVEKERKKLKRYDALIFVFPIWWYGLPAIMKGYIDRVFTYPDTIQINHQKVLWVGLAGETKKEFISNGHDDMLRHQLIKGISEKMGVIDKEVEIFFDTMNRDRKFNYEKTMNKAYLLGTLF